MLDDKGEFVILAILRARDPFGLSADWWSVPFDTYEAAFSHYLTIRGAHGVTFVGIAKIVSRFEG